MSLWRTWILHDTGNIIVIPRGAAHFIYLTTASKTGVPTFSTHGKSL